MICHRDLSSLNASGTAGRAGNRASERDSAGALARRQQRQSFCRVRGHLNEALEVFLIFSRQSTLNVHKTYFILFHNGLFAAIIL